MMVSGADALDESTELVCTIPKSIESVDEQNWRGKNHNSTTESGNGSEVVRNRLAARSKSLTQ